MTKPTEASDGPLFTNPQPTRSKTTRRIADPASTEAVLFAPQSGKPTTARRSTEPRTRKPSPRLRDEDMPLRPGDVLAIGLRSHNCVIGQVTAVNDHCIRLNLRPALNGEFVGGVVVVMWSQVVEFGPVASRQADGWDWAPIHAFKTAWTEANR